MSIGQLENLLKKKSPLVNRAKIREAYNFASKHHRGQTRGTGESYIEHPLETAKILAQLNLDTETIQAALLHDVIEDTQADVSEIEKRFGQTVTQLVLGVTKLNKIEFRGTAENYSIENFRKMFLSMASDIRVVLIKLADRLHNLKTLQGLPQKKQHRIAQETIQIYAPLAFRLGMGDLKGQLEDLAFPFILPKEHQWVSRLLSAKIAGRQKIVDQAQKDIIKILKSEKIEVTDVHGRLKHSYSLYRKLLRNDKNIDKIYDLVAVRVIVPCIPECYRALGIIHDHWPPLPGRIKDYIALPKNNGYQSLHTTVILPEGSIIEIQIRTPKMHHEAEFGVAASWAYSESGKPKSGAKAPGKKLAWINQLVEWQKELQDPGELADSLKIDVFKDRIFVFTPKGEVLDLPEGATPLDFAYQIHTDIGHSSQGAKVNDKYCPLDTPLQNGDVVEIVTKKNPEPSRSWLMFVKTHQAKSKIKAWFKEENKTKNLESGQMIINEALRNIHKPRLEKISKARLKKIFDKTPHDNLEEVFAAIGRGDLNPSQVMRYLYSDDEVLAPQRRRYLFFGKPQQKPRAWLDGQKGFLTNLAKCCNPQPPHKIVAHVTRSNGAAIHRDDCHMIKNFDQGRVVPAEWDEQAPPYRQAFIEIHALDRFGLLKDITNAISALKINISRLNFKTMSKNNVNTFNVVLDIKNLGQLIETIHTLEKIQGVTKVVKK